MGDRESEDAGVSRREGGEGGNDAEDEPIPASLSDEVVSEGEGDGGEVGDYESDFSDAEKEGPVEDDDDLRAFEESYEARLVQFEAETEMEAKLQVEVNALGEEQARTGGGEMGLAAVPVEVREAGETGEGGNAVSEKKGEGRQKRAGAKEQAVREREVVTKDGEIVSVGGVIGAVGELGETIRTYKQDFERWTAVQRRRRRWWWIGGLLVAVVGFGSGVLVEREFEMVPFKDSTGGWRDHVWDRGYGGIIADCVIDARKRKVEELECVVMVSPP